MTEPGSGAAGTGAETRGSSIGAWARAVRPKQWMKNVLVLAAPGAAGVLDEPAAAADALAALGCFCVVASGTYLLNDARDVESDRMHPRKRTRPIAAGEISVGAATAVGVLALVVGVGLGTLVAPGLGATLAAYALMTAAYSMGLRDVAVLDVMAIASGFVLRAIAGAVAVDVPISDWFFIVTSAGALFMAAGKRSAEIAAVEGSESGSIRATLSQYTPDYLTYLRSVASSVALVAYCLWAFETSHLTESTGPWYQLSIVPFAAGLFRYALLLAQGEGEAPEQVVLQDRVLQLVGMTWVLVYGVAVYGG